MAVTTPRYGTDASEDRTSRGLMNDYQTPDYAASIAITTADANTTVKVAQLTGNLTLTCGVGTSSTAPYVGDTLTVLFNADGSARTVTLSTGFNDAGNVVCAASKKASVSFMFDGATWVETSRGVEA